MPLKSTDVLEMGAEAPFQQVTTPLLFDLLVLEQRIRIFRTRICGGLEDVVSSDLERGTETGTACGVGQYELLEIIRWISERNRLLRDLKALGIDVAVYLRNQLMVHAPDKHNVTETSRPS